jgi:hypothetical protein
VALRLSSLRGAPSPPPLAQIWLESHFIRPAHFMPITSPRVLNLGERVAKPTLVWKILEEL